MSDPAQQPCCTCAGFLAGLFVRIPLSIFGGVMIGIGANSATMDNYGCEAAQGLPLIQILGGILLVLNISLRNGLDKLCGCCQSKFEDRDCTIGGKVMRFGFMIAYDLFFITLSTIWFVVSAVYMANNDYINEKKGICENVHVYNMSMLSIILCPFVICLAFLFLIIGKMCCEVICCKMCKDSSAGAVNA